MKTIQRRRRDPLFMKGRGFFYRSQPRMGKNKRTNSDEKGAAIVAVSLSSGFYGNLQVVPSPLLSRWTDPLARDLWQSLDKSMLQRKGLVCLRVHITRRVGGRSIRWLFKMDQIGSNKFSSLWKAPEYPELACLKDLCQWIPLNKLPATFAV